MLPRLEVTARHRPVAVVGTALVTRAYDGPGARSDLARLPLPAPFGAIEVELGSAPLDGPVRLELTGPDGSVLGVALDAGRVTLTVSAPGANPDGATERRSRRHGQVRCAPTRLALVLTGTQLGALVQESGSWLVRGRVDLADSSIAGAPDVRDPDWLAGLHAGWSANAGVVSGWRAGTFGQLGLRDTRLVSHADGSPYRTEDGGVLFSATSAGPGFFGTAHTSLWELRDRAVRRRGALYFERPDRPGIHGDHATHVLRDGDRWLVATSTWSDFPAAKQDREQARVGITLATTGADLTHGEHVLATRPLDLPTDGPSVGQWDPHLVRTEDGSWLVGYVSARRFFDFHPVLAGGASLDELDLLGAAGDRRATEGTTLTRLDGGWRVLASDGRDNPRRVRARFPLLDLSMHEIGTLAAPYPSNIPWPTLIPPDPDVAGDAWRMLTFDGTRSGGPLAGYGTHGDLIVLSEAR